MKNHLIASEIPNASFPFEGISTTDSIGPTANDEVVQVPLGFVASYYAYLYGDTFISSNGMVSFGSGSNE